MTFQKVDTVQRMMSSIKHFERKLDKLQDDMNSQSQTLSELRMMVLNLSAGNIASPDTRSEDVNRRPLKRTMAIQYDDKPVSLKDSGKLKRKSPNPPIAIQKKSLLQNQKGKRLYTLDNAFQTQLHKMESNQIHVQRHRKAEAVRKANKIKTQKKITEKNLSKMSKICNS